MDLWIKLIGEVGLPVALMIYFIWRDWKRSKDDKSEKDQLAVRINEIEDYQKDKLEQLLVDSTEALLGINKTHERLIESNTKVYEVLISKQCEIAELKRIHQNMKEAS